MCLVIKLLVLVLGLCVTW